MLDPTLLHKVRHQPSGRITARCPACAETGGDRTGNHLAIFPDGRFACAAHAGDRDHRRRIHALAGLPVDPDFRPPDTGQRRILNRQRARDQLHTHATRRLSASARRRRGEILEAYPWHPADVWEDSPQRIDSDLISYCPRHFLLSLGGGHADAPSSSPLPHHDARGIGVPRSDVLWTGEVHQSGAPHHASRWKTLAEWQATDDPIGPMTTPALWQPGTHSRTAANVLSAPYTVLDFDGFDDIKPTTPAQLAQHLHDSLAIIRWLRERQHWHLAAILHTGGKSLHAWFRTPPPEVLETLRQAAPALGIDPGLIGRPEHPCRLPGMVHHKTGERSRVMWLEI